jgi:glutamine cyclotransferase
MKNRSLLFIAAVALFTVSCKNKSARTEDTTFTISPFAGYAERDGNPISTKVSYADNYSPDSIVYFLNGARVGSVADSSVVTMKTDTMKMGAHYILAKVYKDGKSKDLTTNVVLMPARMPISYTFKVIKTFPHDTSAHTQGLSYADGFLYESTGKPGRSEIRKVELETGKVVARQPIQVDSSAKGSTVVGNDVVVFTEKDKVGFVFDKHTLKPIKKFVNTVSKRAWGAASDGKRIFMDDTTNRVWILDPKDYHKTGFIDVFDHNAPVAYIDELEYINGKLYATINPYDTIIEIDPKTGAALKAINMTDIWPDKVRPKGFDGDHDVLNGIAYDVAGQRFFVTGGKWPYVYQIEIVKVL